MQKEEPMAHNHQATATRQVQMSLTDRVKTCIRCGHEWLAVVPHPQKCPKCQARDWEDTHA